MNMNKVETKSIAFNEYQSSFLEGSIFPDYLDFATAVVMDLLSVFHYYVDRFWSFRNNGS